MGPNASSDIACQNSGHFFSLCLRSLLLPAKFLLSTYYVPGTILGAEDNAVIYSFTQTQTFVKHLLCARQRSCNGCNADMLPAISNRHSIMSMKDAHVLVLGTEWEFKIQLLN